MIDPDGPIKGGYTFGTWPNCAVPDCEYKANVPESNMCCAHQRGEKPLPFDVCMNSTRD